MKVLLVLLLVGALGFASAGDHEKMFKKYATCKIMDSCMGEKVTGEWRGEVMKALDKCSEKEMITNEGIRGGEEDDDDEVQFNWRDFMAAIKSLARSQNSNKDRSNRESFYSRNKRDHHMKPYYSKEKILSIKSKMMNNVKRFVCTLKELRLMDKNDAIDVDNIIKIYKGLDINEDLKEDLIQVHKDCNKFTKCFPTDRSPFPEEITRAFTYLKCEKKGRVAACMKHDLRQKADMFELEALGDDLEHLDDSEKMLAVIWADVEVGEEDFGLFE